MFCFGHGWLGISDKDEQFYIYILASVLEHLHKDEQSDQEIFLFPFKELRTEMMVIKKRLSFSHIPSLNAHSLSKHIKILIRVRS